MKDDAPYFEDSYNGEDASDTDPRDESNSKQGDNNHDQKSSYAREGGLGSQRIPKSGGSDEVLAEYFPKGRTEDELHPCDRINIQILRHTAADVALSHDDDWIFALENASPMGVAFVTSSKDSLNNRSTDVSHVGCHDQLKHSLDVPPSPSAEVARSQSGFQHVSRESQGEVSGTCRILSGLLLLLAILILISWPWVFFGAVKAKNGIQLHGRLADVYNDHPHKFANVATLLAAVHVVATFLFFGAAARFYVEMALRNTIIMLATPPPLEFCLGQASKLRRRLTGGGGTFVISLLLASCLIGLSSIISTAELVTPRRFYQNAELRGMELDFTPGCLTWLEARIERNNSDWTGVWNTQLATCHGEDQMLDILNSGQTNMLFNVIGVKNATNSLSQPGEKGGIRSLGSAMGILPIGPEGIAAFDSLDSSRNPFGGQYSLRGRVLQKYTLLQQGLESNVTCTYATASPIRYQGIDTTSTRFIGMSGSCDPAEGLEDILENVVEYPTLNVNNTLTYWACKKPPQPGALDPTYVIYLRGNVKYATSPGNITCLVSPMRSQIFSVDYLSVPGYLVTKTAINLAPQSQRVTFPRYIQHALIGLGNVIREGQNRSSNVIPETVSSLAVKHFNLSTYERNPKYLELYEGMLQGILEY